MLKLLPDAVLACEKSLLHDKYLKPQQSDYSGHSVPVVHVSAQLAAIVGHIDLQQ